MKTGDLIRFKKTGIVGLVTEVGKSPACPDDPAAKVFCTYEDDETGESIMMAQWFGIRYLAACAEPADFNHSAMIGGVL
tara:strand:- start:718 stop:954 length:237 start_codon:yes stop_codon:yes gene_type:complete